MMTDQTPPTNPPGHNPSSLLPYVGRIGSGVRVSASLQKKILSGSVLRQPKGDVSYDLSGFVQVGFDLLL